MSGHLAVISIGPGTTVNMTSAARIALKRADVILGHNTSLDLIASLAPSVPRQGGDVHHEAQRVRRAIELAQSGERVALVCGGDAGVCGLAGLVFEVLWAQDRQVPVTVFPGIPAANAAAALLGAPLMNDYASISLSDQLAPLEETLRHLDAAARADFVICLYNPRSCQRTRPFEEACEILARHRPLMTPVGIVWAAYCQGQHVEIATLKDLPGTEVDMDTIVIIGSSRTLARGDRLVTRRVGCSPII